MLTEAPRRSNGRFGREADIRVNHRNRLLAKAESQTPSNLQFVAIAQLHGRVAFLPFAPARLKCLIQKEVYFENQTIGERLRRKRRELHLRQKDVATVLGVTPWTVLNWENGITQPKVQHIPAIRRFLGSDPGQQAPETIAEHLRRWRNERGWSQAQAAREAGVDPSTWSSWEADGTIMAKAHRTLVAHLLSLPNEQISALMRRRWAESHEKRREAGTIVLRKGSGTES